MRRTTLLNGLPLIHLNCDDRERTYTSGTSCTTKYIYILRQTSMTFSAKTIIGYTNQHTHTHARMCALCTQVSTTTHDFCGHSRFACAIHQRLYTYRHHHITIAIAVCLRAAFFGFMTDGEAWIALPSFKCFCVCVHWTRVTDKPHTHLHNILYT